MITMESVVVLADKQTSVNLEGQTVVLNLPSGNYYQLDEVGARVWSLLRERTRGEEICRKLVEEYEVDAEVVEQDVLQFLRQLASEGLIVAEPDAEEPGPGPGARL